MSWDLDFSRQTCLPQVGEEGQAKLRQSNVLVVGAGGTGSPAIMYLASAGVGRLDVCEPDVVEPSNMHRQILYTDVGKMKAHAAEEWVRGRGVMSKGYCLKLEDVSDLTTGYDVVLDCTDRWSAHRDVVMSCMRAGKTVVHGSVGGLFGRVTTFDPKTPCWLCLHPQSPEGVRDVPRGTLGPVCGIVGSIMAMEALQVLLDPHSPLRGNMLAIEAWTMKIEQFGLTHLRGCEGCSSVRNGRK